MADYPDGSTYIDPGTAELRDVRRLAARQRRAEGYPTDAQLALIRAFGVQVSAPVPPRLLTGHEAIRGQPQR